MDEQTKKTMKLNSLKEVRDVLKTKILSRLSLPEALEIGIIPLDDVNSCIYTYLEILDRIDELESAE